MPQVNFPYIRELNVVKRMLTYYTLGSCVNESSLTQAGIIFILLRVNRTSHAGSRPENVLTSLHLLAVFGHVIRADGAEELDVVVTVIFSHLFGVGFMWPLSRLNTETFHSHRLWIPTSHLYVKRRLLLLHRSPSSYRGHSWGGGCGSCGCGEASWGDLGHSNNSQHHLEKCGLDWNYYTYIFRIGGKPVKDFKLLFKIIIIIIILLYYIEQVKRMCITLHFKYS